MGIKNCYIYADSVLLAILTNLPVICADFASVQDNCALFCLTERLLPPLSAA